jgi:hypothetical protein
MPAIVSPCALKALLDGALEDNYCIIQFLLIFFPMRTTYKLLIPLSLTLRGLATL